MSKMMLKSIFKILKTNNFEIENNISSGVLCTICDKIMIDSHNAPCGCRYCLGCITKYLDKGDRMCPGKYQDCKIASLNINENIHIDHPMNIKISNLILKCPEKHCNVKVELRKLEDHIRVCNSGLLKCPFSDVGCRITKIANDKVDEHLLSENRAHTTLLMECIDNLRNEIYLLKLQVSEVKFENTNLKNDIEVMKVEIREQQLTKGELLDIIANQYQEIENSNQKVASMKNVNRSMENLQIKLQTYETDNLEMKTMVEKQNTEIEQLNVKWMQMCLLEHKLSELKTKQEKLDFGEYVWKIENFAFIRKQAQNETKIQIGSDHFYSHKHGYKMSMFVYPDGFSIHKGIHFGVFFCIMPGPFDDILQWPFKYVVTLSLINQQTGLDHASYSIKYNHLKNHANWNKPNKTVNEEGLGFHKFIQLDQLVNNAALCGNDQIFIKCTLRKT